MTSFITEKKETHYPPAHCDAAKIRIIEERVHQVMFETMRRVNDKRVYGLENYQRNPELLKKIPYYAPDLFKIYLGDKTRYRWIESLRTNHIFYNGKASTLFRPIELDSNQYPQYPTGQIPYAFYIKEGITPSQALDSLDSQKEVTPTSVICLDCGNVCELAIYRALLDVWGTEKFNALLEAGSITQLAFGPCLPVNALHPLIITENKTEEELKEGDWLYWQNDPRYVLKHPYEPLSGQHGFFVEETKKVVGFGLPAEGLLLSDLPGFCLTHFNQPPLKELMVTRALHKKVTQFADPSKVMQNKMKDLKNCTLTESEFETWMNPEVKRLNFERVALLATLDIDQAKKHYIQWQQEFIDQLGK